MQYANIANAASLLMHINVCKVKKPKVHTKGSYSLPHCLTRLVCSRALIPCITSKGEDETLLCWMKLNQTLTLFFSNFQLSSWARICSTTDMASRPCLTYSFSWNKEGEEEQIIISHGDQVMEQSRVNMFLRLMQLPVQWQLCAQDPPHPDPPQSLQKKVQRQNQCVFQIVNEERHTDCTRGWWTRTQADVTCDGFRRRVELSVWNSAGVDHGGSLAGCVHRRQVGWGQKEENSSKGKADFYPAVHKLVRNVFLPLSSSASWVSTLKSRNQVSNQATTKEVMGST